MAESCSISTIAVYRMSSVVRTLVKLKPQEEKRQHMKLFFSFFLFTLSLAHFSDTP